MAPAHLELEKNNMITATAWNNGRHHRSGAGYGLKISASDRDLHFNRMWKSVELRIGDGTPITVKVDKPSFWNDTCRELISVEIGRWFLANRFAPWPAGRPPRFTLIPTAPAVFEVRIGA
jgi:hypothetical protein